jgi:hypothetical protein
MPPPDFHLEKWRTSIRRLGEQVIHRIAPTHFGIYADPQWHLEAAMKGLDEIEAWMEAVLPGNPSIEELNDRFLEWAITRSMAEGMDMGDIHVYETANPSWMSSYGIQRYWNKYHAR